MTSDVFRPFLTYLSTYLLTMLYNFYFVTSDIWRLFWTPLPTLKLDVIYGRQTFPYIKYSDGMKAGNFFSQEHLSAVIERSWKNKQYIYCAIHVQCTYLYSVFVGHMYHCTATIHKTMQGFHISQKLLFSRFRTPTTMWTEFCHFLTHPPPAWTVFIP